ncbi:hypothetical protein ACFL3W_00815 [Pseudomonadota bacterium]|jgi:hypothetical protein
MSNQYDHYQEAQGLITMLRDSQLNDQADSLQTAMDDGSTGNEIFMALRWNIEKLISEKQCTDIALAKAKRLWEELNKALK